MAARRPATGALAACVLGGLLCAQAGAGATTGSIAAPVLRTAPAHRAAPANPAASQNLLASSTLLVFAPVDERSLERLPGVSVGILSAAEGGPSAAQLALDISQGARLPSGSYAYPPPSLQLQRKASGTAGTIAGWSGALARARGARGEARPGLLASLLGGAAYVAAGPGGVDAAAAAGEAGGVASVSQTPAAALPARVSQLLGRRALVVARIPGGPPGRLALRQLAAGRRPHELMIVVQSDSASHPSRLLWAGAAGLGGRDPGELTSTGTGERGLISSADIAPTILAHERVAIPPAVQGSRLRSEGRLDGPGLRGTIARLGVIGGRRLPALATLLAAWALLLLACSRTPAGRRRALRIGSLGVLWAPVVALVTAALAPGAAAEYALLALGCGVLGALSDRLLPWPRAVLAPAVACTAAIAVDALAGSQLLMRSLLGPDPALGSRFHGIGNDLKSALAVLVLAAVAGGLYPSTRGRRAWTAMALAGAALALLEGAARLGAGVGGVVIVCTSFAVAVAVLLGAARARRRALIVVASPIVGLIALAVIDLVSAHGSGHYSGSVLHAHSAGELRDLVVRRVEAAWHELRHGAMPAATLLALAAAGAALRLRARVLAPVGGDPAWRAALYGSLTAGVVGSLVEDSGPLLLVAAVFTGACVLGYLWGRPRPVSRIAGNLLRDPARSSRAPAAQHLPPAPRPERASAASVPPEPARPAPAGASDAWR